MTGRYRKIHNEELHNLCSSQNITSYQIKEDEMGRACGMQDDKFLQDLLVENYEVKGPLGRHE
jgi:hypothetical protein